MLCRNLVGCNPLLSSIRSGFLVASPNFQFLSSVLQPLEMDGSQSEAVERGERKRRGRPTKAMVAERLEARSIGLETVEYGKKRKQSQPEEIPNMLADLLGPAQLTPRPLLHHRKYIVSSAATVICHSVGCVAI
jgi:hypothetical protein